MNVDRARFLVLASAIAGGCSGQVERPPAPVEIAPEPDIVNEDLPDSGDPEPSEPHTGAPTTSPPPRDSPPPHDPLASQPGPFGPAPSPANEGLPAPSFPTNQGQDGMCRAKSGISRPGAGCDDNVGRPGNCASVKLAGGCPSFQFICDHCEGYKTFYKPRVAERAVKCVVAQTKNDLGDGCRTYACGDEALKSACLDPTADAPCQKIAAQCKTTLQECQGLLSGMNQAGRAQVATCAAQGCSFGLWSCIEGM